MKLILNSIFNSIFNSIDMKNPKHLTLLLCFFNISITLYFLLNKNIDYNEKLFIGIWIIMMVIFMVIITLLLNKYHLYSEKKHESFSIQTRYDQALAIRNTLLDRNDKSL